MTFNPELHHRRSVRLKDYDYSQAGAYFVTVCARQRECSFGYIVDREMQLNRAGQMVMKWWFELPDKFSTVTAGEFVVMPNHRKPICIKTRYNIYLKQEHKEKHYQCNSGIALSQNRVFIPLACYKETCVVKRLPKTRSGKILRATMRKIADGEPYSMPSTIDDPASLNEIEDALKSAGYAQKKQ